MGAVEIQSAGRLGSVETVTTVVETDVATNCFMSSLSFSTDCNGSLSANQAEQEGDKEAHHGVNTTISQVINTDRLLSVIREL